jgi:hypothetical protein
VILSAPGEVIAEYAVVIECERGGARGVGHEDGARIVLSEEAVPP